MKKEMHRDPLLVNSVKDRSLNKTKSQSWIPCLVCGLASASIFCLIILIILLAIPITVLVIGVRYRDPRYCPIEPRISLFLIVNGSVSLGWIVLTIPLLVIAILAASYRSLSSIILSIIFTIISFLGMIFLIIWLILGSVWTFRVHKYVTHEYDTINHFYTFNYCHPILYQFTFVYLIVSYVLSVFQCCYYCLNAFRSGVTGGK
jgi:hypothetical protein